MSLPPCSLLVHRSLATPDVMASCKSPPPLNKFRPDSARSRSAASDADDDDDSAAGYSRKHPAYVSSCSARSSAALLSQDGSYEQDMREVCHVEDDMEMMEIGVGKSGLAPPSSSTSSGSSASSSSSSSSPLASKSSRRRRQQPTAAAATVSFSSPSPFATEGNQAVQRLNVFSPIKKSKDSPRVAGIGMGVSQESALFSSFHDMECVFILFYFILFYLILV